VLTDWVQELSAALGITPSSDLTQNTGPTNTSSTQTGPTQTGPTQTGAATTNSTTDATSTELVDLVLDLARDAAHAVDRPAAPLTTFLVGYAAAHRGGGPASLTDCVAIARSLAASWERRAAGAGDRHPDEHPRPGDTSTS
jgi:hypothetical protein